MKVNLAKYADLALQGVGTQTDGHRDTRTSQPINSMGQKPVK